MKRYCTVKEAADILDYSDIKEVYRLVDEGQIAEFDPKPKGRKRIICQSVVSYLKRKIRNPHQLPNDFFDNLFQN